MSRSLAPIERRAFTIDEVAAAWGVSRAHIERLIASGELESFRAIRRRLIPAAALERFERAEGADA